MHTHNNPSPCNFEIRRATVADIESVVCLFEMYRVFYGKHPDEAGSRSFLSLRFQRHESAVFLALDQHRPIGFTQLYPVFSSTSLQRSWILNDLFVHPDHRRKGIASKLMESSAAFASNTALGVPLGVKDIELKTAVDNSSAQQLYEKLGWTRLGTFLTYKLDLQSST
jgi:GNAT superfamily N-acetyltransferase